MIPLTPGPLKPLVTERPRPRHLPAVAEGEASDDRLSRTSSSQMLCKMKSPRPAPPLSLETGQTWLKQGRAGQPQLNQAIRLFCAAFTAMLRDSTAPHTGMEENHNVRTTLLKHSQDVRSMEWRDDERLFPLKLSALCHKATEFDGGGVRSAVGQTVAGAQSTGQLLQHQSERSATLTGADIQRTAAASAITVSRTFPPYSQSRVIDSCGLRGLTSLPFLEMGYLTGRI
ncbi:hypothetical protein EYF80_017305 [Liparis tanakae]|uniref:Uncharacterized protein n=1 Tax=Liparis tanakae TaxID=230148 RepID=A0A4Z2I392_9TELE|nr:hypothetical protein EYF80_017305 [Liparis tanakae]